MALTVEGKAEQPKTAVFVSNPNFNADPRTLAVIVAEVKPPAATITVARTGSTATPKTGSATLGTIGAIKASSELPNTWEQAPVTELAQLLSEPMHRKLHRLGWSVRMLSGDLAVEEAVLGVHKPRILQFATHGFSLNGPSADSRKWDNPLLRSGMVLAGVNKWSKEHAVYYRLGKEIFTEGQARTRGLSEQQLSVDRVEVADGILTAYEVTGMNLQGTELVNLTACQTGLGEVTPDGVVGLRQSFLLAGARSLTMSMWEVPAEETGRQISNFYERWLGEGKETRKMTRYQAFRSAQLAALARVRQRGGGHPFYWAGLIYVGDPGDLSSSMTRREK